MSGARRDPTAAANSAVTLMKQAVEAAIEHGDIKIEVVCKAVGMSRSQMQTWLASRAPSAWRPRTAAPDPGSPPGLDGNSPPPK